MSNAASLVGRRSSGRAGGGAAALQGFKGRLAGKSAQAAHAADSADADKGGKPAKHSVGKTCIFLCSSRCGCTKSPMDSEKFIEWEYPDGSGTACFFCAAAFRNKFKKDGTREECVSKMRMDKDYMDTFNMERKKRIEKTKVKYNKGTFTHGRARTGPAKTLERSRIYQETLLPPAPDALPWQEYKETVNSKLQKHLGHYKKLVNGKTMVLMPPAKGTPWKLQAGYASQIQAKEVLQEADSDDSSDNVEEAFDALQEKQEEVLEESTKGAKTMAEMIRLVKEAEKNDDPKSGDDEGSGPSKFSRRTACPGNFGR